MNNVMHYQTIRARLEDDVAYLQLYRPDANNTINAQLIDECMQALNEWQESAKIIVLEGLPEVFCFGADFAGMASAFEKSAALTASPPSSINNNPGPLYDLWLKLAQGPFITIANVKGKVNAGGIGFVAACDVVLAEEKVMFSLSELLFSLMPACVLPFLIRRTSYQKAHYMTMMTRPISAAEAREMGLVDAISANVDDLLRNHLLRLKKLSKKGILRYKNYMNELDDRCVKAKEKAIAANQLVFSDTDTLAKITRYINTGKFPWENDNE